MIVMPVAQDKSINLGGIYTKEIRIVENRLGRETKIDEHIPCLVATPGFDVQRQAELADQRPAGRLVRSDTPAKVLDLDRFEVSAGGYRELLAVDHDAHR
jgi:hypothetical protein